MTLKEYLEQNERDYDVYDSTYDDSVTICWPYEPVDDIDQLVIYVCSQVNIDEKFTTDDNCVCDWAGYILKHKNVFRAYSNKYWKESYKHMDDDALCELWIQELHAIFAGYTTEEKCGILLKELKKDVDND